MHRSLRNLRGRVFPDHWSLMFGQIAFYSFVVVLVSGVVLMAAYEPSVDHVVYDVAGDQRQSHGADRRRRDWMPRHGERTRP